MQNPRHHQIYFKLEETTQKASIPILEITKHQATNFHFSVAVQDLKDLIKSRQDRVFSASISNLRNSIWEDFSS